MAVDATSRARERARHRITQQYLTVLQARDQAELARKTLERNDEFLKLAAGALQRRPRPR